ncbi:MAG: hypothetical protein ACK491_08115, partial [Pseudanabaena sp.]
MTYSKTLIPFLAAVCCQVVIADSAPSATIPDSGNVIQLNGQPWSGRWIRKVEQGRQSLYVQEDWLTGGLGVQMMDSDKADRQRLRWFSSPTFSLVAFDNTGQFRYLDLAPFAEQWRTEIAGNALNIYTPDAAMQAVRRSKQPWGDRIVIDLNRRTPWRVTQQGNVITVFVSAEVASGLPIGMNAIAGNLVKSVNVQPQGKLTQIQIQMNESINPAIEMLSSPTPKIVIDLRRDYIPPSLTVQWAEGLRRIERVVEIPNKPKTDKEPKTIKFSVTALEVDLKSPRLKLR